MENEKFQDLVLEHIEENKRFQDNMLKYRDDTLNFQDNMLKFQDETREHMTENKRFQDMTMEHMVRLTQEITIIKQDQQVLTEKYDNVENRLTKLETVIENDFAQKFEALFDGQKQMIEQLNRIEENVNLHDEIIIKRIK